uniref:Putative ovule protein n=1 Tax=Solanum chacoense TaxID=4108 RepID=A0A0V0GI59_SOLCH
MSCTSLLCSILKGLEKSENCQFSILHFLTKKGNRILSHFLSFVFLLQVSLIIFLEQTVDGMGICKPNY